jgi:hypothetical protein
MSLKILVYKRTHIGDPDQRRQFGINTCMGSVRGFAYDAVIGVGGFSRWPRELGIAGKVTWVGRNPRKSPNPKDSRGPLVTFALGDFRLMDEAGPQLEVVAPALAARLYGAKARFIFRALDGAAYREAVDLVRETLDGTDFDSVQDASPYIKARSCPPNACVRSYALPSSMRLSRNCFVGS